MLCHFILFRVGAVVLLVALPFLDSCDACYNLRVDLQSFNVDVAAEFLDGGGAGLSLGYNLLQRWLFRLLAGSAQQMFGLAVEITLRLDLVTAVALCASREVVVLAL